MLVPRRCHVAFRKFISVGFSCLLLALATTVCASGGANLGFKTNLTVDADTQRVTSMYITQVSPGSLAKNAGLKSGDELIEINGRKVHGALIHELWEEKQSIQPGDIVRLRIKHSNGVIQAVELVASPVEMA